jgi:uncharacterized protein
MVFLIGLAAGLFGGLVGLGGGVIMIPLLAGVIKLDQYSAQGTSLVALVFTGLSGTIIYGMKGAVDVTAALLLAAAAMMTTRGGIYAAQSLPEWKLKRFFGGFLLFISLLLVLKPWLPHFQGIGPGWNKIAILLLTGLFTGFLSGMMGMGGGSIMVPAMVLVLGFEQHLAQGTSLLAMIPPGVLGAYTHRGLGNVRVRLLRQLIPGILVGMSAGGIFANRLPEGILRVVFALILIFTAIRYLMKKTSTAVL